MSGHDARVSSLAWNEHILSSGSRDSLIINHDVRIKNDIISTLKGHKQEVCGLKWSPDGINLASGGNDNLLNIWNLTKSKQPIYKLTEHKAAVKAISWCPYKSDLLVSGGGSSDGFLRFWNVNTGQCVNKIDTKSQVCSVLWSKNEKELVSSHGFSKNHLSVWKYSSKEIKNLAELTGHTSRVLQLAMNPDGTQVVSAAGDETLRFWKIFNPTSKKKRIWIIQILETLTLGKIN